METWIEPGVVTAVDGYVVIDGPGSVAVAMTPDAAQETGERLIRTAIEAGAKPGGIRLRPMFGDSAAGQ